MSTSTKSTQTQTAIHRAAGPLSVDELLSPSPTCETIGTAPTEVAPSRRDLTKSAPVSAKTRGVSMASTQHKTDPRPGIKPDDHRHGTTAGFHAGCRESCCRRAIARYEKSCKYRAHAGIQWAIPAQGTQRRIQGLMRMGWTSTDIASEAGLNNRNGVLRILNGQKGKPCRWVERKTYRRIAEVYERLSMTHPEPTSSRLRTRSLSARKGYALPLEWDDIDHDLEPIRTHEIDEGVIDEVKVRRVLDGVTQDCTPAERLAVIDQWRGSTSELERITGWNVNRITRVRNAA